MNFHNIAARNKIHWEALLRMGLFVFGFLIALVSWQNLSAAQEVPAMEELWTHFQNSVYVKALKTHMPGMAGTMLEEPQEQLFREYIWSKVRNIFPIYGYTQTLQEYDTQVESKMDYERIIAKEAMDEKDAKDKTGEVAVDTSDDKIENEMENKIENKKGEENQKSVEGETQMESVDEAKTQAVKHDNPAMASNYDPVAQVSLERLNDFDFLMQNYYQVDRTTTISSSQLNAQELLAKDLKIKGTADLPQILIYHTHSQERYADSAPSGPETSIVGVGEYLKQLLEENYDLNVLHHTGEYDVVSRDNAYSFSGPALEKILAENPSIEIVIDLHRDGIAETLHLVSEINGKQTAKIMFFNGLSRTTANGDIAYLANPYLMDNLAFSLQMKVAAEQYYPGLTRPIYLKGYRYNLHYCPRSILVEVGAQTNSFDEAINAMEPLADLLHKVLK
ncbi:stage II sporulation protein P [Lachnospiraceae bacterium ZAX-1]